MQRREFLSIALAGLAASILPAFAASARTVSYGSGKLDLYPVKAQGAPIVMYVHGGAWKAGSKSSVGSQPDYFNALGYCYISVGYSLGGNVGQQARQIGEAVAWVSANAASFGGDPSRIALMGHSAGCQLASLAVLSGLAQNVRALVANDTAAYDVAYLAEINNGRLPLLYAPAFRDRSRWTEWSPITHAAGGNGIPVLVAWSGGRDRDRISQRFAAALESGGHPVTRFAGTNYNHISISKAVGRKGDGLTRAITAFLEQTLAPLVVAQ